MKHHFDHSRLAKLKVLRDRQVAGKDVDGEKLSGTTSGMQTGGSTSETNLVISNKKVPVPSSPAISLPAIHSRENPEHKCLLKLCL